MNGINQQQNMAKMIRDTSQNAYESVRPELGERQRLVFNELKKYGNLTNMELAVSLGVSVNTVTPRIFELRKFGKVAEWGKRECRVTGRTVISWQAVSQTLF